MLEIELFRFDKNIDLASYFKPYIYQNYDFKTVRDLLLDIQKNDPYFKFENVKFIKINDYLVNLDENLEQILEKTKNFITISPLIEKRATKDLTINNDDFLEAYERFEKYGEKELYLSLEPLFYSNKILAFKDDFIGNSALVFAYKLIEKDFSKKDEILSLIKNDLIYFIEPKFLLNDPFETKKCVENLQNMLDLKPTKRENLINFNEISNKDHKKDFSNFNIAVYGDKMTKNFIKNIANLINFNLENEKIPYDLLKFDEKIALKLAGEILFDAFDSGADFLLVNSKQDFDIFDSNAKKIESLFNRKLHNFYVLDTNELLKLLNGNIPKSLNSHKLKPLLVEL